MAPRPDTRWSARCSVVVDCLHLDLPFFAACGQATGGQRWIDEGGQRALGYVALLQYWSGLFHHLHVERTDRSCVLGRGRGRGWALLGLLDVIEAAPWRANAPAVIASALGDVPLYEGADAVRPDARAAVS